MTLVRSSIYILLAVLVTTPAAMSETLTLFSAEKAGADVWSWSTARAKPSGSGIKISEKSPDADYGDVFLSDRFPYFKDGEIYLDVDKTDGTFALQVLTFKGDQFIEAVNITKNSAVTGPQVFSLQGYRMPEGTEMITFKIWIGGEKASMKLNDLRYTIPVELETVVLDKKVDTSTDGKADNAIWSTGASGGTIRLKGGEKNGSVLFSDRVPVFASKLLILDAPKVENGTVTVQLPVFDGAGTYLSSVDAIKKAAAGFSSIRLDSLEWPAQADAFEIKIWLGGAPNAEAQIRRILVLK